jgi:Flp pilus assembly protein TadD
MEVVNVEPLFTADPQPEILEIFPWIPGQTHIVSETVSNTRNYAYSAIRAGDLQGGIELLQRCLSTDPLDSRAWFVLALAEESAGDRGAAEAAYRRALELFPGYPEVRMRFASLLAGEGRREDARSTVKVLLDAHPDYPGAAMLYNQLGP